MLVKDFFLYSSHLFKRSVNQEIKNIVDTLYKNCVKLLVLTKFSISPSDRSPDPLSWYLCELKSFGYSFENCWNLENKHFEEFLHI